MSIFEGNAIAVVPVGKAAEFAFGTSLFPYYLFTASFRPPSLRGGCVSILAVVVAAVAIQCTTVPAFRLQYDS